MSASSLNGGVLSLSQLTIGGQTFTGASGITALSDGTNSTTASSIAFTTNVTAGAAAATWAATANGMELDLVIPSGGSGSGNVNAAVSTTSNTALNWVAGVYNPGDIVFDLTDTTGGAVGGVYVCSATTTAGGTAPHLNAPGNWNLLVKENPVGVASIQTTSGTGQSTLTGAVILTGSAIASTSGNTITLTAAAGSGTSFTGDATGSVATTATSVAVSVSATAQTGVLTTASTMVLPPPGGAGASAPVALINPGATIGGVAIPSWVAPTAPATSPYTLTLGHDELVACKVGSTDFPAQAGIFQNAVWSATYQLIGTNSLPLFPICCPQYNPTAGVNPTTYVFQCAGNPGANALAVQLLYAGS